MSLTRTSRKYPVSTYARAAGGYVVPNLPYGRMAKGAYNAYKWAVGRQTPSAMAFSQAKRSGHVTYSKKTRYMKRNRPRRRKSTPSKVKTNASRISKLSKMVEADMGTHIWRARSTGACVAAQNLAAYHESAVSTNTVETALTNLKYYNPSTPGTLTTASAASGTYAKEFLITNFYSKITVRNNYQVPAKITIYCVVPKDDTSVLPVTAFVNGLADVGNPSSTSQLVHLTDSILFTDMYRIVSSVKKVLNPGQQADSVYAGKPFTFDPHHVDTHSLTYQARYNSHLFIIRCEGVLGHDNALSEYGTLPAAVDFYHDKKIITKYSAGVSLTTVEVINNADTFTNGGVVSQKPTADNQAYSHA